MTTETLSWQIYSYMLMVWRTTTGVRTTFRSPGTQFLSPYWLLNKSSTC